MTVCQKRGMGCKTQQVWPCQGWEGDSRGPQGGRMDVLRLFCSDCFEELGLFRARVQTLGLWACLYPVFETSRIICQHLKQEIELTGLDLEFL